MTTPYGMPIWYELMTTDVDAAKRFYAEVIGWSAMPFPSDGTGPEYSVWSTSDGQGAGGLMALPDGAPAGPGWFAYFHVADVDAKVKENEAAGGVTHMPPDDLPDVGRTAMIADPQGIVFYLMTPDPAMADQDSTSFSDTLQQRCSWNELATRDHKAALAHYGKLLGWVSNEAMPMPGMGDYSFVDVAGTRIGAMMDTGDKMPSGWTFYFKIPDVDAAVETVKAGGGQVLAGPMEVPGGQRIIVAADPQGATVGFVSGERA